MTLGLHCIQVDVMDVTKCTNILQHSLKVKYIVLVKIMSDGIILCIKQYCVVKYYMSIMSYSRIFPKCLSLIHASLFALPAFP